jgi:Lrp/AsnC family transcriptional regulator, leucine-responsive regulatory protein
VRVNPRCVGLGMIAYVRIEAGNDSPSLGQALAAIPAVQEVHQIAGTDGYLVKIRVADLAALGRVLSQDLRLPGVRATRTDVVLSTLKETLNVPLDSLGASAAP